MGDNAILMQWMEKVYLSDSITRDLLDDFFRIKGNSDIISELNELIHQLDITGDMNLLKQTPEFLMYYYILKEYNGLQGLDTGRLFKKFRKIVGKMNEYNSYEAFVIDFKEAIKNQGIEIVK